MTNEQLLSDIRARMDSDPPSRRYLRHAIDKLERFSLGTETDIVAADLVEPIRNFAIEDEKIVYLD